MIDLRLVRTTGVMLIVFLGACARWAAVPLEPERFSARAPATGRARVTLTGGTEVVLNNPVISGDTLVALGHPGIPLQRIRWVELRRIDGPMTAALAVLILGPVILKVVTSGSAGGS